MAKAIKTASGKWTIRCYHYTDPLGKVHMKRFTGSTRSEVLAKARAFEMERDRFSRDDLTVEEAVRRYIDQKAPVLSPATVLGYDKDFRSNIQPYPIAAIKVNSLKSEHLQAWINTISAGHSPKTVRNVYALLLSSVKSLRQVIFDVKLPQRERPDLYTPTEDDVRRLIDSAKGDLRLAILLAAFGPLRRGEIAGLRRSDLDGDRLTIRRAIVKDKDGNWVEKPPKTFSSYRTIIIPSFLAEELAAKEDRLVDLTPAQISNRFQKLVLRHGFPHIRFHDLRHFAASYMHAMNICDATIQQRGGWQTNTCLRRVYIDAMDDAARKATEEINSRFSSIALDPTLDHA